MQRRCGARLTHAFTAALLTVLTGVTGLLVTPAEAQAAEPVALVSIALNSIEPALPERDGSITLTGRVTNTSNRRLYRLQALFWRNQVPVAGQEGLEQALASESNNPLGARRTSVLQDLYTLDDPFLEPAETVDFSLTAQISDLGLAPTDGVYLMGVHVLQDNAVPAIGRARVFVPVLDDVPDATLRITSVVELSSRPSLVRPGVLSDDHLAAETGPGGRLRILLDAAQAEGMTFAVDPLLIEELTAMRAGYTLVDGRAGAGQAAAVRWLTDFERLRTDHDGYRVLYGSPDIAALVHAGQQATLEASVAAGDAVEATRSLPLLVLPADGAADEEVVEAAEDLEPAAILLTDPSAPTDTPLLAGPGKAPLVALSSTASLGGPGPAPQETPVHLQQRMLADTWLQASTAEEDSTLGRVRLVTSPDQIRGGDVAVDAPWIRRGSLTELLRSTPTAWDHDFRYSDAARDAELSGVQLDRIGRLNQRQRAYADLLVDPDAARTGADAATARAASSFWRQQNTAQRAWLAPQLSELDATLRNAVTISSTPRVSTVAREGVRFPITIQNTVPATADDPDAGAVRVRLEFTSDNTRRLKINPIEVPLLRAGDSITKDALVTAKANGTVPVTAQLVTQSGLKVGRPVTIEVKVTQNGTTGWVIALAAGIVLVGTTALRIRQVTRERARTEHPETGPGDALSSAPPTDLGARRPADDVDHVDV